MDANVCQHCGKDYRAQASQPAKEKTIMPVIGGVLILIGGIITLGGGLALVGAGGFLDSMVPVDFEGFEMLEDILTACGAILVVFALIAILGGIFGIMRKHFGLVLLGGIFGLIGWFIPSLIGIILVAISKKEFE